MVRIAENHSLHVCATGQFIVGLDTLLGLKGI